MGHHATYRKRGTSTPQTHALVRPSAPVLTKGVGRLLATSSFSDNVDGRSYLYLSDDGGITFNFEQNAVWSKVKDWGLLNDLDPGLYYATTLGNGTDYINESDPSNIVTVP